MHGRRVALGSDVNGAGQLPGPRFGPQAAAAIADERDRRVRPATGAASRRAQVFAQTDGVAYTTPIENHRAHRFPDYSGEPFVAAFDAEERDFWEAIAIVRTGIPPQDAEQPNDAVRPAPTKNFIVNLATGLGATARADIPVAIPWNRWAMPFPLYHDDAPVQLAAFLARQGQAALPADPQRTRELTLKLRRVWQHWHQMEGPAGNEPLWPWRQDRFGPAGSGLYDASGRIHRSRAGERDFDVNVDGMAHYGLLPDFLQDVANVGVPDQVVRTLYRSAEDYIRVWETCERRRTS
jgi:hypothetical protein